MNTDTGELAIIKENGERLRKMMDEMGVPVQRFDDLTELRARLLTAEEAQREGFEELPPDMNRAAHRAIAQGRNPIAVNTSTGKLARWARSRRRR